jgi:ABC-type nitrate/sulfonate/bicarbonate transport system permease component
VVTQVLPIITLAPLFIAVLGMSVPSKVAMVAIMCFFPVFMNLMKGIEQTRAMADGFLSLYAAPMRIRLPRVYLPLALPSAFVGIKIATAMAVLGAIVAEFLGAYYGLGKNLYNAPKLANAELTMISAILTAAMGAAVFKVAELTERRLTGWE